MLNLTPKKGDQVDYWVQAKATIDIGGRQFTQDSNSLMRYEVIETSPALKLELVPKYMAMSGGGQPFSSFGATDDNPELQKMFSKGFEVTLDKDSGNCWRLRPRTMKPGKKNIGTLWP